MSNISRRKFLKGAGVAALAVAAAGVLTGCGNSNGNKVTPTPTPTTKPVQVKYVLGDFVTVVGSQTINVDITKLTNPTISSGELTLPEELQKDYSIVAGNYPINKGKDGEYSLMVIVRETKGLVPVVFYVKKDFGKTEEDVTDKVLPGRKVRVDADATTVDVSDVQLPDDCGYVIMDKTAEIKVEGGKRVARVWVAQA